MPLEGRYLTPREDVLGIFGLVILAMTLYLIGKLAS
jgi:hypothetical protein